KLPLAHMDPEVVVMLVGVNNLMKGDSPAETALGVIAVAHQLRRRFPEAHLIVLSLFPASPGPDRFRDRVIHTNREIAIRAADLNVHHLDLSSHFMDPNGMIPQAIMHDGLHLTEVGYAIWARAMEPTLQRLMGPPIHEMATAGA